jgi:RES domain-containing protein
VNSRKVVLPDTDVTGVAYRALRPYWAVDPLSGEGAKRYGGRFNPIGTSALYLALSPLGALAEYHQAGLPHRPQPVTLCAYAVDVSDIVDLTLPEGRELANITLAGMSCDFRYMKARNQQPPTWAMAEFLISESKAGVLTPSYAQNAAENPKNLMLWRWGDAPPQQVKFIDDHEQLPKNRDSWM